MTPWTHVLAGYTPAKFVATVDCLVRVAGHEKPKVCDHGHEIAAANAKHAGRVHVRSVSKVGSDPLGHCKRLVVAVVDWSALLDARNDNYEPMVMKWLRGTCTRKSRRWVTK